VAKAAVREAGITVVAAAAAELLIIQQMVIKVKMANTIRVELVGHGNMPVTVVADKIAVADTTDKKVPMAGPVEPPQVSVVAAAELVVVLIMLAAEAVVEVVDRAAMPVLTE
jgi:hypothetical protein